MRMILLVTLVTVFAATGAVRSQEIGEPQKGQEMAQRLCGEYHAVQKSQMLSPNPSAPRFVSIAAVSGMSSTALYATLQTWHRTMPNVILDNNQMTNIIAYILSLRDER
jgi:hypothetical protein